MDGFCLRRLWSLRQVMTREEVTQEGWASAGGTRCTAARTWDESDHVMMSWAYLANALVPRPRCPLAGGAAILDRLAPSADRKLCRRRRLLATVAAPVQPALAALQANGFLLGKRIVRRVEGAAVSLHRDAVAHLRADRQKLI